MIDTSGFYKYNNDEPEELLFAPNFVHLPSGTSLTRENRLEEDDLKLFDSQDEAYLFHNIKNNIEDSTYTPPILPRRQF